MVSRWRHGGDHADGRHAALEQAPRGSRRAAALSAGGDSRPARRVQVLNGSRMRTNGFSWGDELETGPFEAFMNRSRTSLKSVTA
ncbi:MAG: hypothetical protein JNJ83_23740 [Verrucomicrobiaceae bacterium]|nr:hypothetical protein [Verrucomicrobiaceae bacterium]